jgi:hypothetical protein
MFKNRMHQDGVLLAFSDTGYETGANFSTGARKKKNAIEYW